MKDAKESPADQFVDQLADAVAERVARRIKPESATRLAPRWLDLESAAQLMNTTKAAVRGMARAKLFPVKKMGGRVMVDIKDLEKAFDENTEWLG
ncbi:MAG: hypothetical protein ABSB35_35650 [Bryobacteraceae bacterium]|jgi:hypothetical protein